MLTQSIKDFLNYCEQVDFSDRSMESLISRLKQFKDFCNSIHITNIQHITYANLLQFVAEFGYRSEHIKKSRIWTLHQFFHFLTLKQLIPENIALQLPYPKIGNKIPPFLTIKEFNLILEYFAKKVHKTNGLRNLIIVMLMGFLGLRTSSIVQLDLEDAELNEKRIWIKEKGKTTKRSIPIPDIIGNCLKQYMKNQQQKQDSLFLSTRKKRISDRTLQQLFRSATEKVGIDKNLHPHLFRHTAATHLNKVVGTTITQYVLGHARRQNTKQYTHLNPDLYAVYMKKHPYMNEFKLIKKDNSNESNHQ